MFQLKILKYFKLFDDGSSWKIRFSSGTTPLIWISSVSSYLESTWNSKEDRSNLAPYGE